MARIHGKAADLFLDEFEISGVTNRFRIDIDNGLGDVTAFADADETYVEGKAGFRLRVDGMYSTSSPNYDGEIFTDLTSTGRQVGLYPPGTAAGDRGYEAKTNVGGNEETIPHDSFVTMGVDWVGDTPLVRSWVLHRDTALAATATGTAYNVGAPTAAQTIYGVLRVVGVGGAGSNTLDVTIQSDTLEGFGSPTTRLTFTQVTTSVTFEVQSSAGALAGETWWRAVLTYAGAGTRTYDVIVTFGIRPT